VIDVKPKTSGFIIPWNTKQVVWFEIIYIQYWKFNGWLWDSAIGLNCPSPYRRVTWTVLPAPTSLEFLTGRISWFPLNKRSNRALTTISIKLYRCQPGFRYIAICTSELGWDHVEGKTSGQRMPRSFCLLRFSQFNPFVQCSPLNTYI
jgi:hypothetical protein